MNTIKTIRHISFDYLIIIIFFTILIACKTTKNNTNRITSESETETVKEDKKTDWFTKDYTEMADKIYHSDIKTCLLFKTGLTLNEPVIQLGSEETVTLKFDDLSGNLKDYSYSIIHCDRNWKESGLTETEFSEGFFINPVTDYRISFNTLQKYVHYSVSLPNEDLKILLSGNYIIKVFFTNDPEQVILTKRFMVTESKCIIQPQVKRPSDLNERYFKQEIDFSVFPGSISNYENLHVVIRQNSRWDNEISGFQPLFFKDKELVYDLDQPDIFNGGNEFRFFDIRSTSYTSERVLQIKKTDSLFEAWVVPEESRAFKKYLTYSDIDGKFVIENQISANEDHHTEADYLWVNFYLKSEKPVTDGTIYIFGALSDWNFRPEFLLNYDDSLKIYHKKILLKQGYYNYEYILLKDNVNAGSEKEYEGDHFETENSYSIFIYYRDITDHHDRLVGYKPFTSTKF